MNLLKKIALQVLFLVALALTFSNCKKDDNSTSLEAKGEVEFEITDAPIDNANISGAFVTVTAVKVDGETISSFSGKQTIDLMAYQNGNTQALGLAELETGTYSNVSLVLDYDADVNGDAPGCYVKTTDNKKHSLKNSANSNSEIILSNTEFEVEENSTTKIVMDFDIRKAIKKQDNPQPDDEYDFVTTAELKSSIRVVNKNKAGKVKGSANDNLGVAGDRIVVYAYKKGTYNSDTETIGQGSSNIMFKNAVTSSVAANDGSYNLSFLSEGDYELYYVGYKDEDNDGTMEATGMLEVTTLASLNLLDFEVSAAAEISIDVTVLAIIPF